MIHPVGRRALSTDSSSSSDASGVATAAPPTRSKCSVPPTLGPTNDGVGSFEI